MKPPDQRKVYRDQEILRRRHASYPPCDALSTLGCSTRTSVRAQRRRALIGAHPDRFRSMRIFITGVDADGRSCMLGEAAEVEPTPTPGVPGHSMAMLYR